VRFFNHSTSRVVLPNPAGAEMRVSFRPDSRSSFLVNRGRETNVGRASGGRSLVDTSGSDTVTCLLTSGAHYISDSYRKDTQCRPWQRSDNCRSAVAERFRTPTLNRAFRWRKTDVVPVPARPFSHYGGSPKVGSSPHLRYPGGDHALLRETAICSKGGQEAGEVTLDHRQ
jgi:hypothetical protein